MTPRGSSSATAARKPGPFLAAIVVPFIVALTLSTFAWPAARLAPRDLPLGVAGPAEATAQVEQRLEREGGKFELHHYADAQAARQAIEDRDVYGALVVSGKRPRLLTASAASPLVAGLLEEAFVALSPGEAATTGRASDRVDDVVGADSNDPRGSVLTSLVFPLVLSSVITAVLLSMTGRPGPRQTTALLAAAVAGGAVATAMVQSWLGAFGGTWLVNAGVLTLTILATASVLLGLGTLAGHAGLALGGLTMVLVANPWSGISSAPELLPKPLGLIGQLLPPGAGGNLLRSTAFFDNAGGGGHLAVLLVYAALGFSAIWAGALLKRRRETGSEELEPAVPSAG
jgi:hypothetical protein